MDSADISKTAKFATGDENIWQKDYRIRSYEVDCHIRLSILTFFNYMQKRRPIRIGPFLERPKPIDGNHAMHGRLDKLPALEIRRSLSTGGETSIEFKRRGRKRIIDYRIR